MLLCALLATGCTEAPEIPAVPHDTARTRSAAGEPTGYPTGFPVVPGGRVIEGAVDEGVVRTAVIEYQGACDVLEPRLQSALDAAGARVIDRTALALGSVSIRAEIGGREASFSMTNDPSMCLLRTIASDRP